VNTETTKIVKLYTLFDKTTEECLPIFEAPNEKAAARNCWGIAKSEFPEDYELWEIGTLDKNNMEIKANSRLLNYTHLLETLINKKTTGGNPNV